MLLHEQRLAIGALRSGSKVIGCDRSLRCSWRECLGTNAFRGLASSDQKTALAQRARRHGRVLRPEVARRVPVRTSDLLEESSSSKADEPTKDIWLTEAVEALQGKWGDDIGLAIEISGREARFTDEPNTKFQINDSGDTLELRGARLIGTPASPIWKFPWGVERRWARAVVAGSDDTDWEKKFHNYKAERLRIRKQMNDAISSQDFSKLSALKAAWEGEFGFPFVATPECRGRLAIGRGLVPGVCFVHKKFGYRGVVVACEPWCAAPANWRAQMGVPMLSRGEAQPFYHCLVDDRDRKGGQITFVGEENVEPSDAAFPIQGQAVELLFVRCESLGGYLPSTALELALQRQQFGNPFKL